MCINIGILQLRATANIKAAVSAGWIVGSPNGTFAPNQNNLCRCSAIINRILIRHSETVDDIPPGMVIWSDYMDVNAWFYWDIQEATNSNHFTMKEDDIHKAWTELIPRINW